MQILDKKKKNHHPSKNAPHKKKGDCQPTPSPLGDQTLWIEVSRLVHIFLVISKFGLHSIGAKKYCCFRRTVDLIAEDPFLHLQEEELLCDVLDQLFRHILWEELGAEFELEGILLSNFLSRNLRSEATPQLSRVANNKITDTYTEKGIFGVFVLSGEWLATHYWRSLIPAAYWYENTGETH